MHCGFGYLAVVPQAESDTDAIRPRPVHSPPAKEKPGNERIVDSMDRMGREAGRSMANPRTATP